MKHVIEPSYEFYPKRTPENRMFIASHRQVTERFAGYLADIDFRSRVLDETKQKKRVISLGCGRAQELPALVNIFAELQQPFEYIGADNIWTAPFVESTYPGKPFKFKLIDLTNVAAIRSANLGKFDVVMLRNPAILLDPQSFCRMIMNIALLANDGAIIIVTTADIQEHAAVEYCFSNMLEGSVFQENNVPITDGMSKIERLDTGVDKYILMFKLNLKLFMANLPEIEKMIKPLQDLLKLQEKFPKNKVAEIMQQVHPEFWKKFNEVLLRERSVAVNHANKHN